MQINQLDKIIVWKASILEQSLSRLGQGIILLSNKSKVLFLSELAKDSLLKNDGLVLHQDRLVALSELDNERLQELIALTISDNLSSKTYTNIYIHRKENLKPYLLLINKIQLGTNAETFEEVILILINDTHANAIHWHERLRSKYNLTKREAILTVLLTEGRTIKEISVVMDIAEATSRQYLKNCYKKMKVQRQHEMVCLALDSSRKR